MKAELQKVGLVKHWQSDDGAFRRLQPHVLARWLRVSWPVSTVPILLRRFSCASYGQCGSTNIGNGASDT